MNEQLRSHASIMTGLADRHQIIVDLIGDRAFHYVDIPIHWNIGDLLIMSGTVAFFARHGLKPRLIASKEPYQTSWLKPDEAMVLHGGGNFGDLYVPFQSARERIIQECPDNRIIILPQSLHFSSEAAKSRSAEIFRRHRDLHICVRDAVSYETARDFSENVYLLPDMAHHLYPIAHNEAFVEGPLFLRRCDDEKLDWSGLAGLEGANITDWPDLVGERERTIHRFRRFIDILARRRLGLLACRLAAPAWIRYVDTLVADAVRLFARHERIVTDRLHGHILACLMDKPNIVLDNFYGKNTRYIERWTGASPLLSLHSRARHTTNESTPPHRAAGHPGAPG